MYPGHRGTAQRNEINGIINVLKPPGMTSHDVVNFMRRILKVRKAGHTGTLDPGVAGVLPICLGNATRIIEYIGDDIKQYRAEVTFGRTTDTQDSFGETIKVGDAAGITEKTAVEALLSLPGLQSQIPPMVSAVKHKGRRLYELAREGIEVDRKPRGIEIFEIEIIRCWGFGTSSPRVLFDIKCSKGTYVRTICHDIGEMLGCGGFMSFLVRLQTSRFHISDALTLEEISEITKQGSILETVLPIEKALPLTSVWVYDDVIKSVRHGNPVFLPGVESRPDNLEENELVKLMNSTAGCLAVARVVYETITDPSLNSYTRYIFQPVKVFC